MWSPIISRFSCVQYPVWGPRSSKGLKPLFRLLILGAVMLLVLKYLLGAGIYSIRQQIPHQGS